jgi:ketosteroid isomerase-like protein
MAGRNTATIEEIYRLARRADHRAVRLHLHEDVTWHPAKEDAWRPCTNADEVVRTILWRTEANRLRPGEMIELGDHVIVQLRGRRLERLGGRGFIPRLFQIVVVREGKVASIRDFGRREDAHAAAGLEA